MNKDDSSIDGFSLNSSEVKSRKMKMVRALLLFPMALVLVIPVHATPATLITGTAVGGEVKTSTTEKTPGGITITTFTNQVSFRGGMQGSGVFTNTIIVNSMGQGTEHVRGLFTGTVNRGQPGTAEVRAEGTVSFTSLTAEFQVVIGQGTSGLEGLHGQGTATESGNLGVASYSFMIHFDPA